MKTIFLLSSLFLGASTFAYSNFECRSVGSRAKLFSSITNTPLYGYSFSIKNGRSSMDRCLRRINTTNNDIICSTGDDGTVMASAITGLRLYGHAFRDLNGKSAIRRCIRRVRRSAGNLVCSLGDDGVKVVSGQTGQPIYGLGFVDRNGNSATARCVIRLRRAGNKGFLCTVGANGIKQVDIYSGQESVNYYRSLKSCWRN